MYQGHRDASIAVRMEQKMTIDTRATDAAKGRRGKR
jgi:hypothetical protein